MSEILEVLREYEFYSTVETVEKISVGNINKTYKITTAENEKYILQKINTDVFTDVEKLMWNIKAVTEQLKKIKMQKMLDKMCVLNIKFTRRKKSYCVYNGNVYRAYEYISDSTTFNADGGLGRVYGAGRAFGQFSKCLADSNLLLYETIEDFHNTPKCIQKLKQAFALAGEALKKDVSDLYEYFISFSDYVDKMQRDIDALPKRVVHYDTKLSNVVFNSKTGEAMGVLDLDTVCYGYYIYDFGDGARSFAGPFREDEANLDAVSFDLGKYYAFAKGYLLELESVMTESERELLPEGVKLVTLELAVRFLTDYLEGDIYFKTEYNGHNLARAKCMAALLKDICKKSAEIVKVP